MRLSFRAIPTVICLAASLIPAAAQEGRGRMGRVPKFTPVLRQAIHTSRKRQTANCNNC